MRRRITQFSTAALLALLAGCNSGPVPQESTTPFSKAEVIAEFDRPTELSKLTPYELDGKLICFIGNSSQKPTPVPEASFDEIVPDMTIEKLVDTLGPGFSRNDWGTAFISWYCDDGRELHVSMNINSLGQIPKIYKHKREQDS